MFATQARDADEEASASPSCPSPEMTPPPPGLPFVGSMRDGNLIGDVDTTRAQQLVDGKDAMIVYTSVGRVLPDAEANRLLVRIYDDAVTLSAKLLAEGDRQVAVHLSVVAARAKVTNVTNTLAQTTAGIDRDTKELRSAEEALQRAASSGQALPEVERRVTDLTASLTALQRRKALLEPSLKTADQERSVTESRVRESVVAEALADLRATAGRASERISAAVWSDIYDCSVLARAIQEVDPLGTRIPPPGSRPATLNESFREIVQRPRRRD